MKYPHIMVRDGVWYPAGTDVPVGTKTELEHTDNVSDADAKKPKRGRKPKE